MVTGASAALETRSDWPLGLKSERLPGRTNARPTIEIAANGTSLEYVVISATRPATLTPRRFVNTAIQIAASVIAMAASPLPSRAGKTLMNEPVNARAMGGSDAQIEIQ